MTPESALERTEAERNTLSQAYRTLDLLLVELSDIQEKDVQKACDEIALAMWHLRYCHDS